MQIIQLEGEVERLQSDKRQLEDQCADLQAQLLHSSMEGGGGQAGTSRGTAPEHYALRELKVMRNKILNNL